MAEAAVVPLVPPWVTGRGKFIEIGMGQPSTTATLALLAMLPIAWIAELVMA